MQVVNCSTAAQYFHVLRRQARQLPRKPLVIMTPKSLLRFPDAASSIDQFTSGGFLQVIGDDSVDVSNVTRVLLCSGRVYYDLVAENKKHAGSSIAIVRVEQFYPFPKNLLVKELSRFSNAADVRWVQEEPENMGGWSFMEPRLLKMLGATQILRYIGRP